MATIPTTLSTQTAGGPATSSWANDVKAWIDLLANPPQASVYRSAAVNLLSNTTYSLVSFDAEAFDTDSTHSLVTNPSRITFQTAGKYHVIGGFQLATNSTGLRTVTVEMNGGGVQGAGTVILADQRNAVVGATSILGASTLYTFDVGDYIEMFVRQNSGSTLAISTGERSTFLEVAWRGI